MFEFIPVFFQESQSHLEFTCLVEIMESEGLKILKNVIAKWIIVLDSLQRLLSKYKRLMAKMSVDRFVLEVVGAFVHISCPCYIL